MNRRWLMAVLAAQAVFFIGWAVQEESHRVDKTFLLATEPFDPRDPFAGQYMDLRYPAGDLDGSDVQAPVEGTRFAVKLENAGDTLVAGKSWPLWQAVTKTVVTRDDDGLYPAADGWARGEVSAGRIRFGIERYYFSEVRGQSLAGLRSGRFFVLAALGSDGKLRIKDLIH
jgi:uncharacterized membrane-anchored protein